MKNQKLFLFHLHDFVDITEYQLLFMIMSSPTFHVLSLCFLILRIRAIIMVIIRGVVKQTRWEKSNEEQDTEDTEEGTELL